MLPDYHMHTPFCRHAHGEPEEYAAEAVRKGLAGVAAEGITVPRTAWRIPAATGRVDAKANPLAATAARGS